MRFPFFRGARAEICSSETAGPGAAVAAPGGEAAAARLVVVVGMHRSGTSLCANIVHALGADMGDGRFNQGPANAKGHWERPRVVGFNDRILGHFHRGWGQSSHVLAMPEHWLGSDFVQQMRAEAGAWLRGALPAQGVFGFKDPRTSLLLPFWQGIFADLGVSPLYVFCVRHPSQVVRSLALRDGMDRKQAECRWMNYNVAAIEAIGEGAVCVVPYERWFENPQANVSAILHLTRLPVPQPAILRDVIDSGLRHDSVDVEPASAAAVRLWRLIACNSRPDAFDAGVRQFAGYVGEFNGLVQPLLANMEVLRKSVSDQGRVIKDLQALVKKLRAPQPADLRPQSASAQ